MIKIELTERQCFAIVKGGIGNARNRKRFGATNITKIFWDALDLPKEEFDRLDTEWKKCVKEGLEGMATSGIPNGNQKTPAPKRINGYIVRD